MQRFLAVGEGVTSCANNLVGKHFEEFPRCPLDPINKNSVLLGFSFNFLGDRQEIGDTTVVQSVKSSRHILSE